MPRRSNLFQEVVAIIHAHMAEGALVEESAMLRNRATGKEREVDVVIRSQAAGHELVVAVEASAPGRKATVEWVERMVGKHKHLPTDKLVLVSESGFADQALRLAEAEGVVALAPADVSMDPAGAVVDQLRSLWPKTLALSPGQVRVHVRRPGNEEVVWFKAPIDLCVFFEGGEVVGPLVDVVRGLLGANMLKVSAQIGLADIAEDVTFHIVVQVGPPWTVYFEDEERRLFVRWEEEPEPQLDLIEQLVILAKAEIRVSEVSLAHRRLGEVIYSYGEGSIAGKAALLVMTGGTDAGKLTIRIRDEPEDERD